MQHKLPLEFELFVKDTERYVILISILSHAVGLLNLALGTPSTHTLEWKILSSSLLRLVQDALALPVCRLEPEVPSKSRCRTSTAVPI